MKFFWPILLICLVLGNTKADEKDLNKLVKVVKFLKVIGDIKEGKRKLQQSTDDTTGDTTEEITLDSNRTEIPIEEAKKNKKERKIGNITTANYYIKEFYGFNQSEADDYFTFFMVFIFKVRIPKWIKMRLKVIYATRRLRNLDGAAAESVPCRCDIYGDSEAKGGETGNGEDEIDYKCKGDKEAGRNVSFVNLDTDTDMETDDGTKISFDEVNFSQDADKQAGDITAAEGPRSSDQSQSTNPVYRKSSSGLSGGAIAGIVIACVAVLIAAAVAAIMLRKPTPPIDNTTVVDLKQENI